MREEVVRRTQYVDPLLSFEITTMWKLEERNEEDTV